MTDVTRVLQMLEASLNASRFADTIEYANTRDCSTPTAISDTLIDGSIMHKIDYSTLSVKGDTLVIPEVSASSESRTSR